MSPTNTACNQIPVGHLHCQHHPYDKELTTTCIDCSEKLDREGFYQIRLHNTVLFPEGGGQPLIPSSLISLYIQRACLLYQGTGCCGDHMQQHSGQHLLSAVLEQAPFRVEPGSWHMGATRFFIELETRQDPSCVPTPEQLQQVELRVNKMMWNPFL